jgi:hypothetical protein
MFVVHEDLKTQGVVLIVPEAKPVVQQKKPVGTEPIAVEKLLALPIARLELCSHRVIYISVVLIVNPREILIDVELLIEEAELLLELLPVLDLIEASLEVPLHQILISLDQCPHHVRLSSLHLLWLLHRLFYFLARPLFSFFLLRWFFRL